MMTITEKIKETAATAFKNLYNLELDQEAITVNATKPEFDGDYTIVLFSLIKLIKKSPVAAGEETGTYLLKNYPDLFQSYNVIKGFLNLTVNDQYWISFLEKNYSNASFGTHAAKKDKIMVEYASPNTNKPLHLGHLRNIFLGWSTAEILKASGHEVVKTCLVNDRGIHICKSMLAWQMFGKGSTPATTGIKGDHFVGDYYVMFNEEYKKQVDDLMNSGMDKDLAEKEAPIMKATQQMLQDWEAGDEAVLALWREMNSWVYQGFNQTYQEIGIGFDKIYYESQTYLLGKDIVEKGLMENIFFQKPDGSVWIDLTADGLDEKLVRRKDGTSVYITQDIGLVENKYNEYHCDQSVYVIGDEQNYHMKVLKLICRKLNMPSADGIYHLSYGMVELPTGKMKSREGTVVDADDLVHEMIKMAETKTEELGKVQDFDDQELNNLYETLGLGALKFYLLRVDPKRKMIFNPEESIDMHGFTGPFIQYTHARIKSILRKFGDDLPGTQLLKNASLLPMEKEVILTLEQYSTIVEEAGLEHDPSKIAVYIFNLAKVFNSFYTEHSIGNAENLEKKILRLQLATLTADVIKKGMHLLGIRVPERM